jgi:uncharacterized membrane protein
MVNHPDPAWLQHVAGWFGVATVTLYFCVAAIALRWRPKTGTRVVRYEPPPGISPATAAYLLERGITEKPLAVALVSMAAKGYLRIEQGPSDYLLTQSKASIPLEPEEQIIAERVFFRGQASVRLSQLRILPKIAFQVREFLESNLEPNLLSSHFPFFVPGFTISLWCFLVVTLYPEMQILWDHSSPVGLLFPALLAVWFLLSTVRTLPALIYKIESLLPGRVHRMRFVKRDSTTLVVFLLAVASLGVMAWATSPWFALQFGSYVLVNLLGWVVLRAPTADGRAMLEQLSEFRMFLAEVDSDRVNRMNAPNATDARAEKYWGWALALDIEHSWGEQFAAGVLNQLGPGSAMLSIEANCPEEARASQEVLDLRLR